MEHAAGDPTLPPPVPGGIVPPGHGNRRRVLAAIAATGLLASAGGAALAARTSPPPAAPVAAVASTTTSSSTTTTSSSSTTTSTTAVPATAPAAPTAAVAAPSRPVPTTAAPVPLTLAGGLEQALAGQGSSCLVVEQDGAIVFERNPTAPLVPASAQKIMVGAAALARLGGDFRFETTVVAPAQPGSDGRLEAAWLVGAGDPYLATPDYIAYAAGKPRLNTLPLTPMAALADGLAAAGVREIPGGIQGDESRYDTARSVPTWKPSYVREAEVGSLGALTVNEGLASWGPSQAVAPDPSAAATSALTALLNERGVAAGTPPASAGVAPAEAVVIASVRSAPLADIVAAMLRASDNYAAEMLLREVDRAAGGRGSTPGGAQQVVEEMARAGVGTEGVHLNDGSGLDLGNRSTCRALLGSLALSSRPGFGPVADGLAVAGRSGTLVTRFVGTPIEGRLAAKTGWLRGAAALVGRLDGAPGRRFALVVNGDFDYATAKAIQDRVVDVLATAP